MKSNVFKKDTRNILRSILTTAAFSIAVIGMISFGLHQAESSSRAEGLRFLDESIRRAVVKSYTIEGRYPDTLERVEERYGVFVDRSRYLVHYDVFASNIMPSIIVIDLNGGGGDEDIFPW